MNYDLWTRIHAGVQGHECCRKLVVEKHSPSLDNSLNGVEIIYVRSW